MRRIIFVLLGTCMAWQGFAQPAVRRNQAQNSNAASAQPKATDRASLMFPVTQELPSDAAWRRDIYRELDLTKDKNAALYYPVEPTGGRMNLITYLFRLLSDGRIQAYEYKLNGRESFASADKIDVKELLAKYNIYYEENNGRITIDNSDIPSAEVTKYYIKESAFYDQRTSTFRRKVVAICPVMEQKGDFDTASYPLFWLKYDDIASFMTKAPVMSSNLNNASTMTVDDYFTLNKYDGSIYMTNNMQGTILARDSTRMDEHKKVEQQLEAFEKGIWNVKETTPAPVDSTALAANAKKSTKEKTTASSQPSSRRSTSSSSSVKTKAPKSSSSGSTGARVSVRRERR